MGAVYHKPPGRGRGWSWYRGLCPPFAQEGLMHVRYAPNPREHLGGIEQREKEGYNSDAHLTLCYLTYIFLPSCCAPARPSISSAPSLKVGPPPLRTFEDRGSCDTTALRKSTCHNPRVTRSTLLACIDLPWRDDVRCPVQTGPALLACLCLPAPIHPSHPSLHTKAPSR